VESEPFGHEAEFAGTLARNIDPFPVRDRSFDFRIFSSAMMKSNCRGWRSNITWLRRSSGCGLQHCPAAQSTIRLPSPTKGVVTGDDATPKSPAERLGLAGKDRAKAEKCLADAIYFESRGETERGQIAVAQVVINRVFSGYYPEDVCGTVYQNAHRHLACQFTFACEGKKLIVNDQSSWARATRISRGMLDGKLWLNEVGKATHYHANWVRPRWVREMRTIQKIGVHTFYRPHRWDEADRVATGG
jgi:hypothetical protein